MEYVRGFLLCSAPSRLSVILLHPLQGPRFPVVIENPTFGDIISNFSAEDMIKMVGMVAVSFPVGYFMGGARFYCTLRGIRLFECL
jgi:NADH-ubiquinone oxidoreductase complex I subunit